MQLNLFGYEKLKKCNACNEIKNIICFSYEYHKKNKKYYYRTTCKKCRTKYRILNYKNDINQLNRRKIYAKNWEKKNKEKVSLYKKKHAKKRAARYRKRYHNDYLFRIKCNVRSRLKFSFIKNGYNKNTKTANILKTDWDTFKNYIENQFTDNMSWDNFDQIHIDHRIPLAAASTEFEVIALNHYTNLQPLWAEDNLSKSDKYDPEDFKKYMDWYRKNVKSDLD